MYLVYCTHFHDECCLVVCSHRPALLLLLSLYNSAGLSDVMSAHIPQFVAHCICGNDLLKMSKQQLDYLRVSQRESIVAV